jgi:general secretion pathway protein G
MSTAPANADPNGTATCAGPALGGAGRRWALTVARWLWYHRNRPRQGIWAIGFTMIEMMIVLAIIGTILAIALPMFQRAVDQARVARAIGDISALQVDIAAFEAGGNGLPETLADVGRGGLEDPWGNPYRYLNFHIDEGGGGGGGPPKGPPKGARKDRFLVPINSTYDLYSVGKDGKSVAALTAKASKDDIVRANDGGFIGLAVKY